MGDEKNGTTYGLYPHDERRLGKTPFYHMPKSSFIDYFNLIFILEQHFFFLSFCR